MRVLCPLVLTDDELDEALSVWEDALQAALGASPRLKGERPPGDRR
jgi:hypothetical protein